MPMDNVQCMSEQLPRKHHKCSGQGRQIRLLPMAGAAEAGSLDKEMGEPRGLANPSGWKHPTAIIKMQWLHNYPHSQPGHRQRMEFRAPAKPGQLLIWACTSYGIQVLELLSWTTGSFAVPGNLCPGFGAAWCPGPAGEVWSSSNCSMIRLNPAAGGTKQTHPEHKSSIERKGTAY